MIAASRLTRRFGSRTVVNDVSFEVARSEIVALLGPNGAGKTTTLRMLAGLIAPTSGTIVLEGVRLTTATGSALRQLIGLVPEVPGLWDRLTVWENLRIYAGLYGLDHPETAIERLLDLLGLSRHAGARAAELSTGMRQKVALARALVHNPPVLLLDEPTAGLDPEISRTVRALLEERRDKGCAILLSTHNLSEAERLADRVAVLQERLIAIDAPDSLRRRLTRDRIIVRVRGGAEAYLEHARRFDPAAEIEDGVLTLTLQDAGRATADLVRALVHAGADLLEVRPEMPALEDVYLHLVRDEPEKYRP
jgi:ABC-2 type transport system ATP-binding protein